MRRDKIFHSPTTRVLLLTLVLMFWNLSPTHADLVSLSDIVGGGDGSGNWNRFRNSTWKPDWQTTSHDGNFQKFIPTNNYHGGGQLHLWMASLFLMEERPQAPTSIQVSSTGLSVTGISDYTGLFSTYDHIWNGDNRFTSTTLSGTRMGAHANKGITFDLDAIEAHYGQVATSYDMLAATGTTVLADADFYLFIDGGLEHSVSLSGADQSFNFSGSLDPSDRFLTLITSSNMNPENDWTYWLDSTVIVQAIPEPSSATMFIVLCAMAMPWQRRKS